jgi:glutamine amidotransferase
MMKVRKKIGILDYGVGNIASLKGALERLNYNVVIGKNESSFSKVDVIFLPGVGCFSYAMENIKSMGMDKFLKKRFENQDVRVIGICLGMQILFEHSEEGNSEGLGLIEGTVKRFYKGECHVGWNLVEPTKSSIYSDVSAFYFNHSYYVKCTDDVIQAVSHYQVDFPVMVRSNEFYGIQFHPEKSQIIGGTFIKHIVENS